MKKILVATSTIIVLSMGSASSADLRLPAYQTPLTRVYSWTGLYVGGNVGYSWGYAKHDVTLLGIGSASESQRIDGAIGGLQSGYNHQFGAWVWGFESDIQASGQKGGSTFTGIPLTTVTTDHKLDWFGTSRTRLGFLFTPNILAYGTAGVAYGEVKDSVTISAIGTGTFKDVKAGWTAGGGVEGVLGGGWSAKVEYLYIDLGKTERTSAGGGGLGTIATETRRTTDNIVRGGLNYRWFSGY